MLQSYVFFMRGLYDFLGICALTQKNLDLQGFFGWFLRFVAVSKPVYHKQQKDCTAHGLYKRTYYAIAYLYAQQTEYPAADNGADDAQKDVHPKAVVSFH